METVIDYTRTLNLELQLGSFFQKMDIFVAKKSEYVRYALPALWLLTYEILGRIPLNKNSKMTIQNTNNK